MSTQVGSSDVATLVVNTLPELFPLEVTLRCFIPLHQAQPSNSELQQKVVIVIYYQFISITARVNNIGEESLEALLPLVRPACCTATDYFLACRVVANGLRVH